MKATFLTKTGCQFMAITASLQSAHLVIARLTTDVVHHRRQIVQRKFLNVVICQINLSVSLSSQKA